MINNFIEYLSFEKKYSKHTVLAYHKDLLAFQNFCEVEFEQSDIQNIHYAQIRSWVVNLVNKGLSNRSVNRKVASLKAYYKFLHKNDFIQLNPLLKHKALKVQKKIQVPFSQKEVDSVINNISEGKEDDFEAIRNKLMVELFYSTGIRRAELINIKHSDVNFYNKTIKILGKRNKERYVSILPSVLETLQKYLILKNSFKNYNSALFVTKKGDKIYETLVYRIINSYFSRASSKVKKSPHILRHTFATHLLNEGASLNSVKELLGHSTLASTQVYTHNSLEQLKKVFNQAHPRSSKKD